MTRKQNTKAKFDNIAFICANKAAIKRTMSKLVAKYGNCDVAQADVIVALGGDGFMLDTLRKHISLLRRGLPVYGMNQGTIGFLMNGFSKDGLRERLVKSHAAKIQPLKMTAQTPDGTVEALAINEISLLRQTSQAAHIRISIDGEERMARLMADGILISTPAGSTAYNLSAHGPVIPLGSDVLALTPISAFRPRRWRGALLKNTAKVKFEIINPKKRPVSAVADSTEFRNVTTVEVKQAHDITFNLLFDEGHELDEKILREQFSV